jgi:glycosyltransferase involved in cell wall biosynthesis
MADPADKIALVYDDDAYVELLQRRTDLPANRAQGLMGRQVAGNEFLDAYFRFGRWRELVAVVFDQGSADSLARRFQGHPAVAGTGRQLRIVARNYFHARFFGGSAPATSGAAVSSSGAVSTSSDIASSSSAGSSGAASSSPFASVVHFPCPFDVKYAWARQACGPGAFCLSGLTHTISTPVVVKAMCEMVEAPVEPFDTLICISRAAEAVVRRVSGNYADYLNDRHGGQAKLRARLVNIPLGVNTEKYRPATLEERLRERAALGIAPDAIVVLFVGRLTFSGKVHPFPMYEGVAAAAAKTGKPVHLVLSGWAPNDRILELFIAGARTFAPNLKCTIVDGTKPAHRLAVWHCADIFTSLTDNIQETLSQTILEAMASGLPVVATDWDGCRDQVIDGQTGFLAPAYMIRGASANLTSRLLIEEIPYASFLGECNQTVAVDLPATTAAFTRLIEDADLRKRMGAAGRKRALEVFDWPRIVGAYENLWGEMEIERKAFVASAKARREGGAKATVEIKGVASPAIFPAVEESFAAYPKKILETDDRLRASDDAAGRLERALASGLTNYLAESRCGDARVFIAAIERARDGCSLRELDEVFLGRSISISIARASIAWMLKYGVLDVIGEQVE